MLCKLPHTPSRKVVSFLIEEFEPLPLKKQKNGRQLSDVRGMLLAVKISKRRLPAVSTRAPQSMLTIFSLSCLYSLLYN